MRIRPTILVVEDDMDHLRLTKRILERSGFSATITVAHDGEEALEMLSRGKKHPPPDLVLLDLNMPKVSGREVLQVMKSDPSLSSVPVVVVSSSDRQEDRALAGALGAAGYISKSAGFENLSRELSALGRFFHNPSSPGR